MIEITIFANTPSQLQDLLRGLAWAASASPDAIANTLDREKAERGHAMETPYVNTAPAPDNTPEQQPELDLEPKETKRRGRPPKAAPVEPTAVDKVIEAVATAPEPMTAAQAEAHMNPTEIQIAPTVEDAITALRRLSGRKGYDTCRTLLDSFGVPKVTALESVRYAEFIAKADELADAP